METRLTQTLVSALPRRSSVMIPGFIAVKAGMRSQGISLPSRMRQRSFSRRRCERGSLSISAQSSLTRPVSSVRLTPGLRSSTSDTRAPLTRALTALRLSWKPTGPSRPPSVKSMSPNSASASVPWTCRESWMFLRDTPQSFSPSSLSGVLRSMWRSLSSVSL